jgi:hypothetical protein
MNKTDMHSSKTIPKLPKPEEAETKSRLAIANKENPEAESDATTKSRPDEPEQMVSAERLLTLLWDESSRPSLRWLRRQQKRRTIPFIRIGRLIWFSPSQVWTHLQRRRQVTADPVNREKAGATATAKECAAATTGPKNRLKA